jgi:hypothetical protein
MPEIQVSNFVAVLEAKRAAFLASVGNITKSEKPLNAKPLNASTSDVLAQLKAYVSGLAHQNVADAIQGELTHATQTALSSNNLEQFKQALLSARHDALTKSSDAVNQAVDKAQQLGEYLDDESQRAIIQFMDDKAQPMFRGVYATIIDFIQGAVDDVGSFLPDGLKKIHDLFGNLSTHIDQSLS